MNSTGHHVPNGWGHDAQGLGTLCPRLGQPMPKGWAYDAQGLGNLYSLVRSRYSLGTIPSSFLNTLEKYLGSLNPTSKAMLVSGSLVCCSNSQALMIRIWRTKSIGVIPTACLILL